MAVHLFDTPAPVELEVAVPAGEIAVETVDGSESTIEIEGSEKLVEQTSVELVGNRLIVKLHTKTTFGLPFSIRDFGGGSRLNIRAKVPHASAADVSSAAADARLRGHFASVKLKNASGDLAVDGEVDGNVEIRTVSGDTRVQRVGGGFDARSVSGDVSATFVGGDVTVKSVSGDVRIGSARQGRFTAQSVSGDIELGVPAGTSLDVDAASASGTLSSEVPLGGDPGALGGGPLLVVRGHTVSGSFRLFRAA
jgi:hypothetical protein